MKTTDNLEETIKKSLNFTAGAELHNRMLNDVINAHENSKRTAATQPNIRRHKTFEKSRAWKVAAVIALICTGLGAATVVGVKIHKWRVVDKHPEGGYLLLSEDSHTMKNVPEEWADNPEHAVKVREELDLLTQQDDRELISVLEKEVNGKLISRFLRFKYVLADGREIKRGDFELYLKGFISEAQEEELRSLLETEEYVTIGFEKKEVRGRMFSFRRNRFILGDGIEVICSFGRPSEDSQSEVKTIVKDAKEADQILNDKREIAALRKQDKRNLIGVDELVANGELDRRVFVYQYQLSDGRTIDLREGDELNFALNKTQRQEWVQCKNSNSGEELGTYEKKVKDRLFVFTRQRFTLSDGTKVIWSYGTLKDNQ